MFIRPSSALVGALLFCTASVASAQAQSQLSAGQVFDLAQRLAAEGKSDQSFELLKVVTQDANADYRAEARVRIARLLLERGDKRGALHWYRELLDEMPNAAAVRIEVALLLASLGEERAAAAELRRAEAIGLPQEVSRTIHNASAIFWNKRPFGVDLSVGLAPDTNINSATSSDTVTLFGLPFQLSDDAMAKSGLGLTFDGSVNVRRPDSDVGQFIVQAGLAGRIYRDNRFNDVTFSGGIGPELSLGGGARFRPALMLGRRIYGTDRLYDFYGLSAVAQFASGRRAAFTINGTLVKFNYALPRREQSGPAFTLGAAYDRALSARLSVRASLTGARTTANNPQFATKNLSADLTVSRDLGHWTVWSRGSYTVLKGDAAYAFFGMPRDDRIVGLDAGLIYRRVSVLGLSPQLQVTFVKAASSLPLFRYERLRSELSVTKSF